ncbi:hypothetical protein [Alkalihalobacillus sp. LMS39]|uniref:hypothetical protein n=1 Tax=Alkalihalobacillus sp. LMS39 TaxID=2924032 RepID=UPI001FB3381F|nr:hypothetical protein [Alkalihalobacillus sp. LMS39]UOE96077.1 hypothetical protein MM271_10955 [Alkalihalobacillus sp. LMS39]
MKIFTVTLKEKEIIETSEGQFEEVVLKTKKYPAALTNKSLLIGKQLGILQGSTITDVIGIVDFDTDKKEEDMAPGFDLLAYEQVIYLAVVGINKNFTLSLEDFLDQYDEPMDEKTELFGKLLEGYFSEGNKNNFARGLQNSTKKKSGKGKRKR